MALIEELDTSAYVNVNFGTGSAAEAARWVEYMNGGPGTTEGRRRATYGRAEPWGVRTWGIGNEMYGLWALGHMPPRDYAGRYLEFRGAMDEVNPGLEYVAVGADHYFNKGWNREVLAMPRTPSTFFPSTSTSRGRNASRGFLPRGPTVAPPPCTRR
jgi:alpha-N-arabinofuranosidase